ncbi:hypothetical protein D3C83_216250 [compost metagenome]
MLAAEARKIAAPSSSTAAPIRRAGNPWVNVAPAGDSKKSAFIGVRKYPGQSAFT